MRFLFRELQYAGQYATILRRFVRSSQSTGGNKDVENLHTSFEAFSNFRGLVLGITRNTNSRFSQFELSVVNFTMLYSTIYIPSGHPLLSGGIAHYVSNVSSHDILSKTKTCILSGHLHYPRIVTTINFLLTKSVHNQEKMLREITKWSPKGKCFYLFTYSLHWFFRNCMEISLEKFFSFFFFLTRRKESGIKTWRCCGSAFKFYFLSGNITRKWLWFANSLNGLLPLPRSRRVNVLVTHLRKYPPKE